MGSSSRRREDHMRYYNDMSVHVGQDGAELIRKTVRSILGDLLYYWYGKIGIYIQTIIYVYDA